MSAIEWTGETWNPVVGCTKVSAGCKHCYAERMAKRLKAMGQAKYAPVVNEAGRWNGVLNFDADALDKPLRRKTPTTYFVNSMSDLFHETLDDSSIGAIFEVMKRCPQHTFQVLTKRAERMRAYMRARRDYARLENVWLGVSIENRATLLERAPLLNTTPAVTRFWSCEPLLEDIAPDAWDMLAENFADWVIVGGESGPGARLIDPDWVRGMLHACTNAGVPFFFKQWGGVNKANAGRLLDGRTWDEMPLNYGVS